MLIQEIFSSVFDATPREQVLFGEGWSPAEDGRRWALDLRSTLTLGGFVPGRDHVLMMVVEPFAGISTLPAQRLSISVDGVTLRDALLPEHTVLACRIPASLAGDRTALPIVFDHPDATQPCAVIASSDPRHLAFAFVEIALFLVGDDPPPLPPPRALPPAQLPEAATLSDGEVLLRFANLGDNCEFGIAQRFAGIEPLGLLRFSDADLPVLLPALADGFAAMDSPEVLQIRLRETLTGRREYITRNIRYGIGTHAHVFEGDMQVARMFARESKRLGLLKRMFIEDLRDGRRIFVYKQNAPVDPEQIVRLARVLREFGPNTLLHVSQHAHDIEIGAVRAVMPGLLEARIDRFSDYDNAASRPSDLWIGICRAAYDMWRRME